MKDKNIIKNRKTPFSNVDKVLSNVKEKYILTEEEIQDLFEKREGMLEAASLYLKDEMNLSFNDIAQLLKRNYKTIWTSYKKAKNKLKNEK